MDFEVPVVVYVAQLPKLVHEEAHAGARRADHVRERLLAHLRDDRFLPSVLVEVRQQQQSPRYTLSLAARRSRLSASRSRRAGRRALEDLRPREGGQCRRIITLASGAPKQQC
jgi:hypothetical protein